MLHPETLRPPARRITAAVFVSTVPSWDVLAHWQNSVIEDQFEIDATIRAVTRELVAKATTPLDKLRAIYEFVARDIRYLNHDVGIFGKKPDKAVNVFSNHFGDCKDKATLMIAMLKEVGIRAAYAGVRTRERGPVFWEVPTSQTNHIITYVPQQPGIEQAMFVDGTSRFGSLEYLPDMDQGIDALVLDGKSHQIVRTPELPALASRVDATLQVALQPDGQQLAFQAQERWTGWFASNFRSMLNIEGKRREEFGKILSYRYPGSKLLSVTFRDLDTLSESAGVEYTLEVPGRVRREDGTLRINMIWPSAMARTLAQETTRHYDLVLWSLWAGESSFSLALPPGSTVKTVPAPLALDNDLIQYDLRCTPSGASVACQRRLIFKRREIPKERYPEWRELCTRIDQAEAQDVVLAPAKAG
jgi:hypothetical protein